MRPQNLTLRCYAENVDGQWQAFCIDLTLAAQGDSFQEVKDKLSLMIGEYVYDALAGEDKDFAFSLLRRRAPLKYWAKFYAFVALHRMGGLKENMKRLFCPPLPLVPQKLKPA